MQVLDRIHERNALAASASINDRVPMVSEPTTRYPLALPTPKLNGAAELKINRDGLDFKVAVSLDMGR